MHAHFQAVTVNFRSCSCPSVIEEIGHYTKEWVRYDAAQGGSVRVTWPMILGMAFPYLQNSGLSIEGQIMKIAERFFFNNHDLGSGADELFDFVEFCAGRANLSRELLRKGWKGCSLDIRFSPLHDMCSQWGLRTFIDCLSSSKDRALHWFGTKCSSFVPLCQSVAQRYPQNNFYGDTNRACVCDGNFQVEVTGLCMFISMVLSCIPVLEQPLGSCMPHAPVLRNLLSWFGMVKTVTYMGCFSGPSVKPLQIWHPPNTLEGLCRQKPSHWDFDSQLASRGHDGSYTGVRGLCQESEAYTPAFGLAVAELYGRVRA